MKTYTIIGGVNGVGKSSLTGVLRSELDDLGIVIDVDQMTAALGGLLSAAACSRTGTRKNLCLNGMRMLIGYAGPFSRCQENG